MSDASRQSSPTVALRLFVADPADDDDGLTPQITLTQLFSRWFRPICLEGENASASTIEEYLTSMQYWAAVTGDPPLAQIDQFTIARLKQQLPLQTFRRGKLGVDRTLSADTVCKHLRNIRAVLRRAGPPLADKPTTELLPRVPHIRVAKPQTLPKRPLEIETARRICAATSRMPASDKMRKPHVGRWWNALLHVLYFTGLRVGTALKLQWDMLDRRAEGAWLMIPGAIVDKTHKPLEKFLHPDALAALESIRCGGEPRMLPWPHHVCYLANRHDHLQTLAGVPLERRLSPQAWRRTHGTQMARTPASAGITLAQHSLDHADERTTRASYVLIEPEMIRQLPPLGVAPAACDKQRRLFS